MEICKCGNEMILKYSNHNDSYYDLYWCSQCGRRLEIFDFLAVAHGTRWSKEEPTPTFTSCF
jgi:hypothetical protein